MSKIICIGSSTKDIIFPISDGVVTETPDDLEAQRKITFELGAKYQLSAGRHESIGGCAANVACGLAHLETEAFCCTRVGDDRSGEWIRRELEKNGVAMDLLQVGAGCRSDLSCILAHIPSEDRVIFSDRDANEKLEVLPEAMEKIAPEWIFVSSLNGNAQESWESKLDKIEQFIQEKNVKLIFNPGQKNIKKNPKKVINMLSQAQILIMNKDEAIEIVEKSGDFATDVLNDEKFLAEKLNLLGAEIIALTDGARGAWGFDGNKFLHIEAKKVEQVADTLGAGDAFSSAFIAAWIKSKNMEEALRWGIINSSNAVKFYGGVSGLLTADEIKGLMEA